MKSARRTLVLTAWTASGGAFASTPPVTQTRDIVVQEIQTQT